MSLRDRILAGGNNLPTERVTVDQWGCDVEVRGMTGRQRADFVGRFFDGEKPKMDYAELYPTLVIGHTFDPETGERVFADSDAEALLEQPAQVLETIGQAALRLSGLQPNAVDAAGKS